MTIVIVYFPDEFVPFRTAQIGDGQNVPSEIAQLPKLLTRTAWTNHQIILQCCTTTEQLKVGSVLQRSLEEFTDFLSALK